MDTIIFIYAKKNKIKALNLEYARKKETALISKGWAHTQTIEPCIFIQHLFNECQDFDIIHKVKSLNEVLRNSPTP